LGARIASRGLRRRKLRNGLTILAVVFAVGILVGVNIAGDSILAQVTNTVTTAQGNIDISVQGVAGGTFEAGNVSVIQAQQGIKDVSPRFDGTLYYLNGTRASVDKPPVTILGVVPSLDEKFGISNVSLDLLSQTNSCIATEEVAEECNLTQGSTVVVSCVPPSPQFPTPPASSLWKLTVVAIANVEGKGYSSVLIANLSLAQDICSQEGMISSVVATVVNPSETDSIQSSLEAKLGSGFDVEAPKTSSLDQVSSLTNAFEIGLNMAATISLAVACILIMNSLLMSVNERKYETGVLRSIGSSRGTIFRMFLLEGLFFGAIGSFFGIGFGIILSQFLIQYMSGVVPTGGLIGGGTSPGTGAPTIVLNANVLVFGVAAGIAVSVFGSLYPALSASRTSVVQAIRPQMRGSGKGRRGTAIMGTLGVALLVVAYYVESTSFKTTVNQLMSFNSIAIYILLTFIPVGILLVVSACLRAIVSVLSYLFAPELGNRRTIANRNTGRNRRRSSLTVSMIAIGLSFTVLLGSLSGSLNYGIGNFVSQQLGADVYVIPNRGTLPISYANNLTNIDGVKTVTYLSFQPTIMTHNMTSWVQTTLVVVNSTTFPKVWNVQLPNSTINVQNVFNNLSQNKTSIILASGIAGKLNVSTGDSVSAYVGSTAHNFTVIATFYASNFMSMGSFNEANIALIDYNTFSDYLPSGSNATMSANVFLVKVVDGADPNTVGERITNSTNGVYVFTISTILHEVEGGLSNIFNFFQVLIAMAIIVSLLGMTTTMIMSVLERKREIGVLRAIGTSRGQIIGMIMGEALILGTVGLITGLAVGLMFSSYMIDIMAGIGFPVPLMIPYTTFLYVGLASIIISVGSAVYPARKAATMNVVDAIRYG
jgi:putative ABC transport system permease protein